LAVASHMRATGSAFIAACALAGAAEAQEFCVACAEPSAVYRCIIDGARPGGGMPLQMLCATAMAKEGRHGKCAVRGGTVFDCKGPTKRVSWAAYNEQPVTATPVAPPPPEPAKAEPDPAQPPRTIEEMAKRANQKTAEQLRKANEDMKENVQTFGEKMTDASKKTWRCLSSFFTNCTE
jgi:hypothetical protein